jgi:glutathione S-transferase
MSSWTAIVTCLALVLYLVHAIRVTLARGRYSIMAPATTGHPTFERLMRIQANTGEQMILFLPSLWLFSLYLSAWGASAVGLVWILARAAYAVVYEANPDKRAIPFALAFAATIILLVGGSIGSLLSLLHGAG